MNMRSLKNLHENLLSFNKDIRKIPLVMQFNKRDLGEQGIELLDIETMNNDLNKVIKAPYLGASAISGENVALTMKKIISLTISSLKKKLEA